MTEALAWAALAVAIAIPASVAGTLLYAIHRAGKRPDIAGPDTIETRHRRASE
jgi:hypothetical protein